MLAPIAGFTPSIFKSTWPDRTPMSPTGRRLSPETTAARRPPRRFYVVGGNLHPDDPSYIERQADHDLYEGLLRGEFCYVLTARQMGKSSLMVRTATRLRAEGVAVAVVDLTGIGRSLTVEQWYDGLLRHIAEDLDLEAELEAFWQANPRLGPLQRWMAALMDVVLPGVGVRASHDSDLDTRLVIFVDEIDAVRSLPFSSDEFFAAIRECYNRRALNPVFRRLTFCLLGVATPGDLVQDTRTTPFNIGRRIELTEFTEAEAAPLAEGLTPSPNRPARALDGANSCTVQDAPGRAFGTLPEAERGSEAPLSASGRGRGRGAVLRRILYWTGGHPCLTQRLCAAVAARPGAAEVDARSRTLHPHCVDQACRRLFLSAEARDRDDNLLFVRDYLLRNEVDPAGLLDLYRRVRRGRVVRDDPTSRWVSILRLSGLVRPVAGSLRVSNRIYARAFDPRWIAGHMPDAEQRRQRAAFRRGLWRATAVAVAIVAVVIGLALDARRQSDRADRSARQANARARELQVALHEADEQRTRADRAAEQARAAARGERAQRLTADAARRQAETARQRAEAAGRMATQESRRATWQERIAQARRAEADRQRRRAQHAEQSATQKLWDAYLAEARALRFSGRTGRRFRALNVLARAARIRPSLALRNEAIASMALADIRFEQRTVYCPTGGVELNSDYSLYYHIEKQGSIHVRSLADNRERLRLPAIGLPLYALGFLSNTERFLAAYYGDEKNGFAIHVWDLHQRSIVLKVPPGVASLGREAFSPDDRLFALAFKDHSVVLYELPTGREIKRLPPGVPCYRLLFRPDGRQFAASSMEARTVQIHDLDSGNVIRSLVHPAGVAGIDWSPDGALLATACADFRVYVWDVEAGSPVRTLEAHRLPVRDVRFSRRGDLVASWTWDETFRIWDPFGGREVAGVRDMLCFGGFSLDDRVAGFSNAFWLPEAARGQEMKPLTLLELVPGDECRTLYISMDRSQEAWSAAFSPDGRLLAAGYSGGVGLWDAATGKKLDFKPSGEVRSVLFDADGKSVIAAGASGLDRWPIERDPATGRVRLGESHRLRGPSRGVSRSRDGGALATIEAGEVGVLAEGQSSLQVLGGSPPNVGDVSISPDGRWIVASSGAGDIPLTEERNRVWDRQRGGVGRDLPMRGRSQGTFSPDSQWLVTGGIQEYRFWRTGSWRPGLRIPRQSHGFAYGPAAFSRDGSMLAIAHSIHLARLIDPANGSELATLEVPNPAILSAFCFSPDGSQLAASTQYGWLYLWDLRRIRRQLRAIGLDWKTPAPTLRSSGRPNRGNVRKSPSYTLCPPDWPAPSPGSRAAH
jgi:WD40 repeat protein